MSIDTVRVRPRQRSRDGREEPERAGKPADVPTPRRRILEVTDRDAAEVLAYARDRARADVHLERKGGRTFVVAE